ncbi:ABC transporter substrate-binding protein [Paenibacillus nasutitermitis]|uniref:Sugar ABC transporter substrate-binding protein n=1 Tax=Paenibacillus nasutitermitis TaxID=1652958 RepID=A0A917DNU6_9BACL|nr:extracellular solute-binding protein [Paenibacillus nasutitermitis]GGD56686.1 sugar ABC transporter substrate-binding protein [Paenibacillus nasutitermitis]
MVKKTMGISVMVALAAGLLAGCGGNTNNNANPDPANTSKPVNSANSGTEPVDEAVTIKVVGWSPGEQIAPLIEEYKKVKSNVTVEYMPLVDNSDSVAGMQKLDLLVASGDKIDVAFLPGTGDYSKRASLDLLAPLNDMIAAEGITLADEYIVDPSINGKVYALPDTYENYFVLLNKDMLDKAGLPIPTKWTWDEYLEYSKKLSNGEGANKVFGTYFHSWPMYFELGLINQPKDNNLINNGALKIDSAEIRKSLEIRDQAENVDKSAIPYSDTISQKLAYRSVYFSQKAAMIVTGNWMITDAGGTEEFPANFVSAFAPMPSNSADAPSGLSPANGNFMAVLNKSEQKQAAYDFIRWYTTKGEEINNGYSAWKKQDVDKFIAAVKEKAKSPDKIDADSLSYVIKNSPTAPMTIPPAFQSELDEAYVKEAEKFILKQQDLETTIKNANAALQKVADANK